MHINTHVAIGIILSLLYYKFIDNFLFNTILIFCICFLIDFDFMLSKYVKTKNHRILPTHGLFIYFLFILIFYIISLFGFYIPIILFIGIAGISHVLIDCIDWGIGLLSPFSNKIFFGILPKPPESIINEQSLRKRQCWFTTTYYKSKLLLIIDIIIFIISIISLIYLNILFWWYYLIYFFFLTIHLLEYYKCIKYKQNKLS